MKVVYHGVPDGMVGHVLHPLNRLRQVDARAYDRQRAKYQGREELLDMRIGGPGLLWNDVVHCAPIHPHLLFEARTACGVEPGAWTTGRFFVIPLERIAGHTVLWLTQDVSRTVSCEPFDADRYRELAEVPTQHLDYLRMTGGRGTEARTFAFVPHVLVAGPIDVARLPTVRWDEPPRR